MAPQDIIKILKQYLLKIKEEGLPVNGLVLYGSHAREVAQEYSDIDVLVLLEDGLSPSEIDRIWSRLEHLTSSVDSRIETWPVTQSRYLNDEISPLIIIARREGIPIAA